MIYRNLHITFSISEFSPIHVARRMTESAGAEMDLYHKADEAFTSTRQPVHPSDINAALNNQARLGSDSID